MPERRVYHWKHGWIPLTHEAAMSKAKGSHAGAARLMEAVKHEHLSREKHITAVHRDGKVAIHDARTGHSTSIDAHTAASLHEQGHHVIAVNADKSITTRAGGSKHTLDTTGKQTAALPHGYTLHEDTAGGFRTGRFSFSDASGRHHYVGGSQAVATRRASEHAAREAEHTAQLKKAKAAIDAKKAEQAAFHQAIHDKKIEHMSPADAQSNAKNAQLAVAMRNNRFNGGPSLSAEQLIAVRDHPNTSAADKAYAAKDLETLGYQTAQQRLAGMSNDQLKALLPQLAASNLPAHEKAGARRYIAERLRGA